MRIRGMKKVPLMTMQMAALRSDSGNKSERIRMDSSAKHCNRSQRAMVLFLSCFSANDTRVHRALSMCKVGWKRKEFEGSKLRPDQKFISCEPVSSEPAWPSKTSNGGLNRKINIHNSWPAGWLLALARWLVASSDSLLLLWFCTRLCSLWLLLASGSRARALAVARPEPGRRSAWRAPNPPGNPCGATEAALGEGPGLSWYITV